MIKKSAWAALLLCCAVSKAWSADSSPLEELDERSGATIAMTHSPFVFANQRSSLAGDARDYVTLSAFEVDRTGRLQLFLVAHLWSQADWRAPRSAALPTSTTIDLQVDDGVIRLNPLDAFPVEISMATRQLKPPATAVRAAFPATLELLRRIERSRRLSLTVADRAYPIWEDGHKALSAFLQRADTFQQ